MATKEATPRENHDGWSTVPITADESGPFSSLDGVVRRARLGPIQAISLRVVLRDLFEQSRGRPQQVRARVREGGGIDVAATIGLDGVSDPKTLAHELTASALRFASSLDVEVDRLCDPARLRVAIHAHASSHRAELDPERSMGVVLEELERRQAEIDRLGEELDETNRGVVALYAELDNYSRQLELRDRRKNEFLAMLAHELRNPLAAMHLAAENLESGHAQMQAARVMRRQLEHLRRMVDDLLDVSRITRGKVEIARQPMDLAQAVRQAAEPRRALAEKLGLSVELHVPDTPLWIEGDPTRIEQVVVNLFDNALKYTPTRGRILIALERKDASAQICVSDTGRGMTSDELRDAFELFVQHSPALDRRTGGLGIGLTLVREIVALHGGSAHGESLGLGRGSTFCVELPLLRERPSSAERAAVRPRAPIEEMRILLVEDNHDFRELLAERLRRRGLTVEECGDGLDALARLTSSALPDAVVADLGLPGMDGYALARAIRKEERLRGLKLVALTGYGGEEAMTRTGEAGFDAHLVKPVRVDALLDTLA